MDDLLTSLRVPYALRGTYFLIESYTSMMVREAIGHRHGARIDAKGTAPP